MTRTGGYAAGPQVLDVAARPLQESMSKPFLYFDLGNVLLHFDNDRAARQLADVSGISAEAICDFLQAKNYLNRLESGDITCEHVARDFQETFATRVAIPVLKQAASDIFHVNVPVVPLVTRLRAAGVRLGILSNTSAWHWDFVSHGRFRFLAEYFDVYALSFQLAAMKPDPVIYVKAAELARSAPSDVWFVDDRPEHVRAARQAGWHAWEFHDVSDLAESLRASGLQFYF